MYRLTSLPEKIPLFPLSNALLLPQSRLPLNIFEPRYLAMLDDAIKSEHRLIGMIQPLPEDQNSGDPQVHPIGCAGRLTSFSETSDGRYMITLTGVCRFRVVELINGFLPYATSVVCWQNFGSDLHPVTNDQGFERTQFLAVLERYFQVMELATDWDSLKDADDTLLINSLAMMCPFEPEEKQALLEAKSLTKRRETLITLMEFALREKSGGMGKLQ